MQCMECASRGQRSFYLSLTQNNFVSCVRGKPTDKDTCAMAIAQEESTTIPGLVYSYATCGSTNTYTVHTVVDTFTFSGDFSSACGSYKEIDYTVDSVEIKDKDTAPTLPPSSAPAPAPAPPSSTSLCENPWIWIAIVAIISINLITTLVLICFLRCWIAIPMASRHEDGKSGEGHHDTHVEVKVVNDQEHQDVEKLHQEFQDLAKEEHVIEEQVTSMQNKMDSFFKELKSGSFRAPKQHSSLTAEAYLESSADAKKQIMQRVDDDYEKLHGEMSEIAREEHALTEQMASMQSRLDSFFEEMRSMNNVHEAGSNSGKNGFERQPSSNDSQSAAPRPRSMNSRPVSMNSQQSSMMAQKTSAQGWQDNNFEVQGEELEETGHQRGMKNFDTSSVDDSQRSAVISTSPKIPTLHLKHLIAGDEGPGYQESGTENMKQKKTSGIRRHSSMVIGNDRQDRNLVSDESAVTKQTKMNRAASMSGRGSERDAHFASDALTPRRVGNGGGLKGLSFSQQRSQGGSGLDWDHAVKRHASHSFAFHLAYHVFSLTLTQKIVFCPVYLLKYAYTCMQDGTKWCHSHEWPRSGSSCT
jgi:cell division protein FtsB